MITSFINYKHQISLITVIDPITNATTSVKDVIAIEEPAICSIRPIRSGIVFGSFGEWCSRCTLPQQAIITNISSTPKPINRNGSEVCTGPYEIPKYEHKPIAEANAIPTDANPMLPNSSYIGKTKKS